ncbi:hypothetical protein Sipo8835_29295 [Streptomyces ipomoeae]|jgi:hypothetical protein|uniref:Calcium-binding protein n=1 Tax=Streptomyces ipomoeae TaxID=103232 RepID=A0AAE8VY45_9ACTN|nr:hypothetical protein [Streptomyces ipomoeae]MDX2695890.1 hypothetical protein [Streptomyces ipomoeae]MDX2823815.1 hypothetical protein [Streptomyces ipomoeae]MDX2841479.1 hypothetical protein [Streptomyces ipomoeae]MDX2876258.1 hypothetical protein [Streptomyces ipomoeae]TQE26424.1 hypothetical protein Sipo8835_29295 [Streptomyces ipomoeae]
MRVRATAVAVSGVLALSAFAVPAAYAAGDSADGLGTSPTWAAVSAGTGPSAFSAATAADATVANPDVTFVNMKVNGGKPIVVGATKHVKVPVTYTLKHAANLDVTSKTFLNGPFLYYKSMPTSVMEDFKEPVLFGDDAATCVDTSSTAASCKAVIDIRPADGDLANSLAGTWKVGGLALQGDVDSEELGQTWQGKLGTVKVQRQAKLTGANASPEPVRKGRTITVTSKLTRANWDTNKTPGYAGQPVKLQFKKKGTSTYKDVKTVKSSSTGALKTTVKATADGSYRFVFAGSNGTSTATSAADAIDVK